MAADGSLVLDRYATPNPSLQSMSFYLNLTFHEIL